MAKSYKEAAATIVDDEELEKQEEYNKNIFVNELKNSLDGLEENIIYDDIYNDEDIQKDIYKCLLEKEIITKKDLLNIFALHNNYIVGSNIDDNNKSLEKDLSRIIKSINYAYRISNLNFIWKKKVDESKKNVSTQLEGVSEAISNLAEEISPRQVEKFVAEKEKIKMVLQKQECGLRLNKENCMYTYISKDKYGLQVGIAKSTKKGSPVSGDTSIQTKLDDGKYLLALSDGMGSGPEARKSSKIAIKMLERLLTSGFEKDTSIKLINSTLSANTEEDMYATLDIQILDLYSGNIEFIKNGACPTYIKRDNEVQILKSESLPTGILEDIDLEVYDKDLEDGDIIVMCSDGILDSNTEYLNKELWVKYLLEDIQTDDVQKIADIIVNEARDNDYGSEKDDMTVIVAKVKKRK